jgi:hypothetical protein
MTEYPVTALTVAILLFNKGFMHCEISQVYMHWFDCQPVNQSFFGLVNRFLYIGASTTLYACMVLQHVCFNTFDV